MTGKSPKEWLYFQHSFIHYLKRMIAILEKYEAIYGDEFENLLQARLAEDMFPMGQQFAIAASFSMRACCWLHGVDLVTFEKGPWTYKVLHSELEKTLAYITALKPQEFIDWENKCVSLTIGQNETQLSGKDLVDIYALPNFFFHLSIGYAILRQQGVDIGKRDFDGLHVYAPGFQFAQ